MSIAISLVSYLNSYPYRYGIEQQFLPKHPEVSISYDIPSECAKKLRNGTAQIGLIPIAALSEIPNAHTITNYGIGATLQVDSVLLVSKVPIEKIKKVYLDFHSRTSINLVQVLFKELWKTDVEFLQAPKDYLSKIKGSTAGVVIGDRALILPGEFIKTDLVAAWHKLTGLPFVFAFWVSNIPLSADFIKSFSEALNWGVDHKENLYPELTTSFAGIDVPTYLSSRIDFKLSEKHLEGADRFFAFLKEKNLADL
jgi:chorismate dehydratase